VNIKLDFNSESEQPIEKGNDQEDNTSDYTSRFEADEELVDSGSGFQKWFLGRKKKNIVNASKSGGNSLSRFRLSKKKKKLKLSWVKLLFKILVIGVVYYNFKYIMDFARNPINNFTQILYVSGICAGINFIAVWVLFYKNPMIRFYLSLVAIIGSFGSYLYVNYMNHSFLGNHLIPSLLVAISVLMAINPKVNYYLKSIVLLLIPVVGIYFSGNTFALVWTLMFTAGLILFFRVSKSKKSKSNKKVEQTRRNKQQTA
jgi:hypothetical protein